MSFKVLVLATVLLGMDRVNALADAEDLASIKDLWKPPLATPCEVVLRDSYRKASAILAGSRFDEVLRIASEAGSLGFADAGGSYCEIVASKDVKLSSAGPTHELVIAVTRQGEGGASCLEVVLRCAIGKAVTDVVNSRIYSSKGLVAKVLSLKHLRSKAKEAPVLVRVDEAFGELHEPNSYFVGHGFTVVVQLSDRPTENPWGGRTNATYRALSGLDPVLNQITEAVIKPTGGVFRATVLPSMRAVTKTGDRPAIWVSVESE